MIRKVVGHNAAFRANFPGMVDMVSILCIVSRQFSFPVIGLDGKTLTLLFLFFVQILQGGWFLVGFRWVRWNRSGEVNSYGKVDTLGGYDKYSIEMK